MDQYLSTYRKDFIWPYVRTFPVRDSPSYSERASKAKSPYQRVPCTCGAEPGGFMPPNQYAGPPDAEAYQWSRLGPMAPLLDPKLYPAKMGPAPEFEITRYDQPNTYLKKLHEKYPYLYNILQSAPPDDMIRRVNEDRLRTTYQVDYSHMDEHPSADYDKLLAKAEMSDFRTSKSLPCAREVREVLDCRANVRPPDFSGLYETGSHEKYAGAGPDGYANHSRGFDDYREVGNRGAGFKNEDRGFGDYREVANDREGFRNEGRGFGNSREVESDRRDFKNEGRAFGDYREVANDRGGFRNEGRGFGNSREVENDRRDFKNEGRGFGDYREVANDRGGFRNEGRGFGDSRDAADVRRDFVDDSGRGAREHVDPREATNRGGDYKTEAERDAREGGANNALKSGDGGGGGGKTTAADNGGFGSADRDEGKSKRSGKVIIDDQDSAKKPLPAWRSEYQEAIGQTGYDIIRDKMHQHGAHSRGRSFIERIIMKCRV